MPQRCQIHVACAIMVFTHRIPPPGGKGGVSCDIGALFRCLDPCNVVCKRICDVIHRVEKIADGLFLNATSYNTFSMVK